MTTKISDEDIQESLKVLDDLSIDSCFSDDIRNHIKNVLHEFNSEKSINKLTKDERIYIEQRRKLLMEVDSLEKQKLSIHLLLKERKGELHRLDVMILDDNYGK